MKKLFFVCVLSLLSVLIVAPLNAQTVTFNNGQFAYNLTSCSKSRAMETIDIFQKSQLFYYFDVYPLDYQDITNNPGIISGTRKDIESVYNGFSYGTIQVGYFSVNVIMYANPKTGKYCTMQFANTNLGGGNTGTQDLRKIFERSVSVIDNK